MARRSRPPRVYIFAAVIVGFKKKIILKFYIPASSYRRVAPFQSAFHLVSVSFVLEKWKSKAIKLKTIEERVIL